MHLLLECPWSCELWKVVEFSFPSHPWFSFRNKGIFYNVQTSPRLSYRKTLDWVHEYHNALLLERHLGSMSRVLAV